MKKILESYMRIKQKLSKVFFIYLAILVCGGVLSYISISEDIDKPPFYLKNMV
jgi:hypothetical protein